jgi:hypothetical protein
MTVVGFVWPGPGEEQVKLAGPVDQRMADELTPVIGIQADQRERQPRLCDRR